MIELNHEVSILEELEIKLQEHEATKPKILVKPELFCEESSKAGIADFISTGYPSKSLSSDEGGIVIGGHGMQEKEAMGFFGVLNRFWEATTYNPKFKNAGKTECDGYRFTANLMLQDVVFQEMQNKAGNVARGIGTFSRFLIARPVSTMGTRSYNEPPQGTPKLKKYHLRLTEIMDMELPTDEDCKLKPKVLVMSKEAKAIWIKDFNQVEEKLNTGGEFVDVKDFASKSAEQATRIAGVFHVFEHGPEGKISEATMQSAIKLASWYLQESKRIFTADTIPPEIRPASRLWEWLKHYCNQNDVAVIQAGIILQLGPNEFRTEESRDDALNTLVKNGYVRRKKDGKKKQIEVCEELLKQ
jgi:putative DNA primase/helicase